MHAATADPLIGRVLEGRYRILARIAVGGMSTVYAAVDDRLDREVAVKVMAHSLSTDPAFMDRFSREARAAARLSHVNAVSVYDQGTDHGEVFLVMELVRGRTLRDLLRERGVLSPAEAVSLMEPVLAALASAHRAGLVHRDVKPENILLSDEGVVKVADFGLARAVETTGTATRTGLMMGTVAYSSPEQFRGGNADMRSDVYSAGVVLFELLTGDQPHVGADAMSVAYAHVHSDIPPPSSRRRGIAEPFDALLRRVTARDPAARPADAGVFLGELHDLRRELHLPILAVPRRPRGGRPGAGADPANSSGTSPTRTLGAVPADRGGGGVAAADDQPTLVGPSGPGPRPGGGATAVGRRRRRRPILRAFIGALVLLLVAAGITAASWYYAAGRYGTIPDVRDRPVSQATAMLQDRGFTVVADAAQPSETVARGTVIGTVPGTGDRLVHGRSVHLTPSSGPTFYAVPDVRNQTRPTAEGTLAPLQQHGVQIRYDDKPDDTVAAGHIIATDPPAGTELRRTGTLLVYVSTGPPIIAVPDVSGRPAAAATKTLTRAGFKVDVGRAFSDTVAKGSVIRQAPTASVPLPKGSTIALTVSKGPDLVAVPTLTNLEPVDQAIAALHAVGLQATEQEPFGGVNGLVLSTDPPAGTMVKRGSTVTLTVI